MPAKISVIMRNYNNGKYMGEAIESVLEQTYRDLELIIVDDGSTDNSPEIISRYEDERVQVIYLPQNIGLLGAVTNRGIKASSGEFVAIMDSDDIWMKEKLETQVNLLESNQSLGLVHTDFQEIDENVRILTPSVHEERKSTWQEAYKPSAWCLKELLTVGNPIAEPTVLIRREALQRVDLYDETLRAEADYDLWLRIAIHYQIGFINEPLLQYRQHLSNRSSRIIGFKSKTRYLAQAKIMTKLLQSNPELYHELLPVAKQRLSKCHYRLSRYYFEEDSYEEAREHAVKVIKYDPWKSLTHIPFFLSCLLNIPSLYPGYRRLTNSGHEKQSAHD